MTHLGNNTVSTDLDNDSENRNLLEQGYTIRHIETYHRDTATSCIIWDVPPITDADLPF